jgi:hypothetical protein
MIQKGTPIEIAFEDERGKVVMRNGIFLVDKGNKIIFKDPQTNLEVIIPLSKIVIIKEKTSG